MTLYRLTRSHATAPEYKQAEGRGLGGVGVGNGGEEWLNLSTQGVISQQINTVFLFVFFFQ